MQELLRAQGAELRDVVKVGGWLTFPMRDYGPLGDVRDELLAQAGLLPASAAVQVGRVGVDGERLAFEAIAFAPEDEAERERERAAANVPARSRLARYYADTRAGGGYVFTSGEVPDGAGTAEAQAREVYERLRSHLAAHDVSPASVVHQTVFVRHPRDREAVAQTARAFFGDTLPPTTLLPAADLGFRPGCDVEIELVAATDGPSADAR
jgi:enamine deaminase RidA (YjgF/YER057c/UK114 family)